MSCNHELKLYQGFTDTYEYCHLCGVKAEDIKYMRTDNFFRHICTDSSSTYANASYLPVPLKYPIPQGRSPHFTSYSSQPPTTLTFFVPKSNLFVEFPPSKWITEVAENDNFYGVNRSLDTTRLAGVIYKSQASLDEDITYCKALVAREGGTPNICLMHETKYKEFEHSLGSKVDIIKWTFDGKLTKPIRGIKFPTAYGLLLVFSDDACPKDKVYLLQSDTWFYDKDFGCYCVSPGYNGVIQL